MKTFSINFTVLKNFSCAWPAKGETEKDAVKMVTEKILKTSWGEPVTKKDIKIDIITDTTKKKGKKK